MKTYIEFLEEEKARLEKSVEFWSHHHPIMTGERIQELNAVKAEIEKEKDND